MLMHLSLKNMWNCEYIYDQLCLASLCVAMVRALPHVQMICRFMVYNEYNASDMYLSGAFFLLCYSGHPESTRIKDPQMNRNLPNAIIVTPAKLRHAVEK